VETVWRSRGGHAANGVEVIPAESPRVYTGDVYTEREQPYYKSSCTKKAPADEDASRLLPPAPGFQCPVARRWPGRCPLLLGCVVKYHTPAESRTFGGLGTELATFGQLRADGAADLTRGGGPYACPRSGWLLACPHEPDEGRREGSLVKSAAALVTARSSAAPETSCPSRQPTGAGPAGAGASAGAEAWPPCRRRVRPGGPP
jgi:hypothetical protein